MDLAPTHARTNRWWFQASPALAAGATGLSASAAFAVCATEVPTGVQALLLTGLGAHLYRVLVVHALRTRHRAIRWLAWSSSGTRSRAGQFRIGLTGAEARDVELLPGAFVHPWLVVARFREPPSRRCHALVLALDCAPRDDLRALRAALCVAPDTAPDTASRDTSNTASKGRARVGWGGWPWRRRRGRRSQAPPR